MAHVSPVDLLPEDRAFLRETTAAASEATSLGASRLLVLTILLLSAFFGWAAFASLEEVTRGDGQIIPSSRRQVVSSLEGGIVKQLLVREGDKVESGQVLLILDDTGFSSNLGELQAKARALRTQIARLTAEARGTALSFDPALAEAAAPLIVNERQLYDMRQSNLATQSNILEQRLSQRRQELAELQATREKLERGLELALKEQTLKAPMARSGVVPKTDMLAIDRAITDLEGQIATTDQAIPRAQAAIREAEGQLLDQKQIFQRDAQVDLNQKRAELSIVEQTLTAARDRVVRTEVRSPVSGVVNALHINTVGGVVKAGEPIAEITPLEDTLLVQARVRPQDIAFVHPGQKALVKITAYDFSIYGGLEGKVEIISSDSMFDERTKEPYYLVTVRTQGMALKKGDAELPIIPGMVATVDILTGEKTVLQYLLKPINKARHEALRER